MDRSNTFGILFWINKRQVKSNRAKLYVRITVNKQRTNICLRYNIDIDSWDIVNSKVKGHSETSCIINDHLDKVYLQLHQCYQCKLPPKPNCLKVEK